MSFDPSAPAVGQVRASEEPYVGPLSGLRVIELGNFIAAPFATRVLGDLGAEVIKVEQPETGDPARGCGAMQDGQSLWWSVHARNKKSITLDLKHPAAHEIVLDLVRSADGVVENFQPGQLERWDLGIKELRVIYPGCVLVVSLASVKQAYIRANDLQSCAMTVPPEFSHEEQSRP